MKNYFEEFYKHYTELKEALEGKTRDLLEEKHLEKAISSHHQDLNNLIMAGLGMGTLYLRMGAIIMIAEELAKPDNEKNISFLKVIADNLVPKPPNDGEWTNIWVKYLELNTNSIWNNLINEANNQNQNINKIKFEIRHFVEFRNNIAHQKISLGVDYLKQIKEGFNALRVMAKFKDIFINCSFEENTQLVFFSKELAKPINVWPYIRVDEENKKEAIGKQPFQANVEGIVPYLFSGKYYQGAKFINTQGGETNKEQDEDIEDNFKEIQKVITNFNGDKAFDFSEKIKNYNDWCIGRDNELNAILAWIDKETDENVLPIFAPAGLGKGALVAKVKDKLDKKNIKHIIHFCGSGAANNLQAILYHLIIQGKEKNYWNINSLSSKFQNRLERLPSQYHDVIEFFQTLTLTEDEISENEISNALKNSNPDGRFNAIYNVLKKIIKKNDKNQLDELLNQYYITAKQLIDSRGDKLQLDYYRYIFDIHFILTKYGLNSDFLDLVPENHQELSKKYLQPLVIIIDGLDEAAVADHSKRITDWFYTYNEKGERAAKWVSPDHIKWIFTYRDSSEKDKKGGYQFESHEFNTFALELVQPLKGLSPEAVKNGLQIEFEKLEPALTDDFLETIIIKGAVK
jgi:hypothetical protein